MKRRKKRQQSINMGIPTCNSEFSDDTPVTRADLALQRLSEENSKKWDFERNIQSLVQLAPLYVIAICLLLKLL